MSLSKICPQCGGSFGAEERFCPKDGSALRPEGETDGLVGQVIADRYQILRPLGEGGMGRVYLAEHVRMGRMSAVKVMSADLALSADAITRFNREAANASRINHPNVAQIYDFGETANGTLYLAMEYIEGETLSAIIGREGALPPARAAALAKQIADGLGAAHHLGIIHRDLKPDNVMVGHHHDGSDWVKLVDFGIAKTVQGGDRGSQTVTTAGVSIGTPDYMSPEQLAGDRLDNRTDVYSLGLVLFNMLTGDLPYPRLTSKDTLVKRLTSRPRTLTEAVPSGRWPEALQAVLDRALAPEPVDRYASVADFGRDVLAVASELTAGDRTVPVQSVSRPVSLATVPALTPTVAVAAIKPGVPSARPSAADTSIPVTSPAVSTRLSSKRAFAVAAAVLVIAAGGVGAFAMRREKAPTSAPPQPASADTAGRGAPTQTGAPKAGVSGDSVGPRGSDSGATAAKRGDEELAAKTANVVGEKTTSEKRPVIAPDSASRPLAVTGSPPATAPKAAATDMPPLADSGSAGREKKLAGIRHRWLNAAGDTVVTKSPAQMSDDDRIRQIAADLQGHFLRARGFVRQGDVQQARGELREATPVVQVMRQLYGGTSAELRVEALLRQETFQTVNTCRAAQADSAVKSKFPPSFRCESLIPVAIRPPGRGRANQPPAFRERQ